jgi:hypothetical protein
MATAGHARFFTASSPWPEQLAGHLPPAAAHAPDWVLVARGIANGDPAGGCSPARSYSTSDAVRSFAPKPNASDDAAWAEGDSLTDGEATSDSGGTSDSYDDDDNGGEGGSGMQNGGSAQRMRTRSGDRPRRPPPPPVGKRKLGAHVLQLMLCFIESPESQRTLLSNAVFMLSLATRRCALLLHEHGGHEEGAAVVALHTAMA